MATRSFVNWAVVGRHPAKGLGVFYSFGRRRVGVGWVYFLPVSDAERADAVREYIALGGRTVCMAGIVLNLQGKSFRHKRVGR